MTQSQLDLLENCIENPHILRVRTKDVQKTIQSLLDDYHRLVHLLFELRKQNEK